MNGCFRSAGAHARPRDTVLARSCYSPLTGGGGSGWGFPALQTKKLKPWTGQESQRRGRWFSLGGQGRHWGGTFPKTPRV